MVEHARIAVGVSGSLGVVRRAMAVIEACFDEPVDVWAPAVLYPQRARLQPSRIVRRVFFAPSLYAPCIALTAIESLELTVPVYGDYDEVIPFHASRLAGIALAGKQPVAPDAEAGIARNV
jgi:hypothetical protein